mmetsp:Transcript_2671/g.4100  ORF Transcript_2671/g.4100 Transcript_2671/m.4100 type:complete len:211 (+) Transcript_2671:164-796(+)
MKNTLAPLLFLSALTTLPDVVFSFTTGPSSLTGGAMAHTANSAAPTMPSPRHPMKLHGLLPSFLTGNKEEINESDIPVASAESISPEMTELALETNGEDDEEELSEAKKLLQKVKQAGTAGAISYALWELAFWGVSIPVCVAGYREVTGHWPDFGSKEDMEKVGAEAFAFVNFARLAVPLRITLALSTTGWIDENVVQKFGKKDGGETDE